MAKNTTEKKTIWDYILKYNLAIAFVIAAYLRYNDSNISLQNQINEMKITIAEMKITINHYINEKSAD